MADLSSYDLTRSQEQVVLISFWLNSCSARQIIRWGRGWNLHNYHQEDILPLAGFQPHYHCRPYLLGHHLQQPDSPPSKSTQISMRPGTEHIMSGDCYKTRSCIVFVAQRLRHKDSNKNVNNTIHYRLHINTKWTCTWNDLNRRCNCTCNISISLACMHTWRKT